MIFIRKLQIKYYRHGVLQAKIKVLLATDGIF